MRLFSFLLALPFCLAIIFLFGASCANIVPPAGGPRDSIAPRLVSAIPRDSTLNFRGDRIELNFDEYIDLQDVPNNLLFTPLFPTNPLVSVRSRTITVRFEDSLERNTTYILNFGSAIRDYNEGNVLRDFTYTFSTGPALDSLEVRGKVVLAQTGGIDTNMIVVLHRNLQDTAVRDLRPQYVTRLDGGGNFVFRNLPAGLFAIYAMSDRGRTRRYGDTTELFAFIDRPVQTALTDSAITMYAYRGSPPASPGSPGQPAAGRVLNRLTFSTNLGNNTQDLQKDLVLTFGVPVRTLDTSRISLSTDSTFRPTRFTSRLDSTRRELTLSVPWRENTLYNLVLDKAFATDTNGKQLLKTDTVSFTTRKESDYGNVVIRLKSADLKRRPVLQFVQNDKVVFSAPVPNGTFSQRRFAPGDYELRILYDTNGNGQWDPGRFFGAKRQPELVQPLTQSITVKPAWDNEYER